MENTTNCKFCSNCGIALNGENFCPNCGKKLDTANSDSQTANNTKTQSFNVANSLEFIQGKTIDLLAVAVAFVFVLLQFFNWFTISLGGFGMVADYFVSGASEAATNSYNICTLISGMIKLANVTGPGTAVILGIIFSIILAFIGLYILLDSITIIRNVYNGFSVAEMINPISVAVIIQSSLAIIGVWVLKSLIKAAFAEMDLDMISFAATGVVAFTKTPVILLILGIASKAVFSSHLKKYEKIRYDEEVKRSNEGTKWFNDEHNRVWNSLLDKSDEELELVITDSRDSFVRSVAREMLDIRKQLE